MRDHSPRMWNEYRFNEYRFNEYRFSQLQLTFGGMVKGCGIPVSKMSRESIATEAQALSEFDNETFSSQNDISFLTAETRGETSSSSPEFYTISGSVSSA